MRARQANRPYLHMYIRLHTRVVQQKLSSALQSPYGVISERHNATGSSRPERLVVHRLSHPIPCMALQHTCTGGSHCHRNVKGRMIERWMISSIGLQ